MTDGLKDVHREAIIAVIAANDRVERAVLFGSRATGTNTVTSDVDIALFGNRLTLADRARLAVAVDEIPMAQSVDLLLYDSISDRRLREHIRNHGVEWYPRATHQWRQGVYGRIPSQYAEATLERLCVPQRGIQTGPFGSQLHKRDYVSDGTPIVTVEHLGDNRLVHKDLPRVSDEDRDRLSRYRLKAGDIVFSRVGSVDRRALVRQEEEGWLFSGRCLRVRGDPSRIDRIFLSYFFGLNAFREHIRAIAVGATMPSLNTRLLSSIVVPYPPLPEQRGIARILGTLDDKVELNRRTNETLEAMARALFKSWFVDFDPVRAKTEGRDTRLPPDIADLFPDRLVESELGEVPEGWVHETVYRFADIVYGAPFASKQFNTENKGRPLIRIRDLATHSPSVSTEQVHGKGHLIDPGDIVVGMDGAFRLEVWKGPTSWLNQRVCHFEPRPGIPTSFLAGALREPLAFFERAKVGTTVIHLGKRDLDTIRLLHPSQEVLDAFGKTGEPLLEKAVANSREARTLVALRDTLLPKLISGEIRVPDAERALESAR